MAIAGIGLRELCVPVVGIHFREFYVATPSIEVAYDRNVSVGGRTLIGQLFPLVGHIVQIKGEGEETVLGRVDGTAIALLNATAHSCCTVVGF